MERSQNIIDNQEPKYETNVPAVLIFVGIILLMFLGIGYAFLS